MEGVGSVPGPQHVRDEPAVGSSHLSAMLRADHMGSRTGGEGAGGGNALANLVASEAASGRGKTEVEHVGSFSMGGVSTSGGLGGSATASSVGDDRAAAGSPGAMAGRSYTYDHPNEATSIRARPGGGWYGAGSDGGNDGGSVDVRNSAGGSDGSSSASATAAPRVPINHEAPGDHEARLVSELTEASGVRVTPPKDLLDRFVQRCASLDRSVVVVMLGRKMDSQQPQVTRAKAMCVLEALCSEYADVPPLLASGSLTASLRDCELTCMQPAVKARAIKLLALTEGRTTASPSPTSPPLQCPTPPSRTPAVVPPPHADLIRIADHDTLPMPVPPSVPSSIPVPESLFDNLTIGPAPSPSTRAMPAAPTSGGSVPPLPGSPSPPGAVAAAETRGSSGSGLSELDAALFARTRPTAAGVCVTNPGTTAGPTVSPSLTTLPPPSTGGFGSAGTVGPSLAPAFAPAFGTTQAAGGATGGVVAATPVQGPGGILYLVPTAALRHVVGTSGAPLAMAGTAGVVTDSKPAGGTGGVTAAGRARNLAGFDFVGAGGSEEDKFSFVNEAMRQ